MLGERLAAAEETEHLVDLTVKRGEVADKAASNIFKLGVAAGKIASNIAKDDDVEKGCKDKHPAHRSDVMTLTPLQLFRCYAQWHDATLAAWRKRPKKCEGRHARVKNANRGFGDAGGAFARMFKQQVAQGGMLFWQFPSAGESRAAKTVWELAIVAPFDWDFAANRHLFCVGDEKLHKLWGASQKNYIDLGTCLDCADRATAATAAAVAERLSPHRLALSFLYQPKDEVQAVVQTVLGQVQSGERLIGVHFRAQWFGKHFGCGCLDVKEMPGCLTNIGSVMQRRGVPDFKDNPRLRYFVASDEVAGLDAFRETFGQRVITSPTDLPIEHSLDTSAAGAIRVLADFLILSNASAILGSCGSTFMDGAAKMSGLPRSAVIRSGTAESRACAANSSQDEFKAFHFSRFTTKEWSDANVCGCYSNGERTQGACKQQCRRKNPPKNCNAVGSRLLGNSGTKKPAWMRQSRSEQ